MISGGNQLINNAIINIIIEIISEIHANKLPFKLFFLIITKLTTEVIRIIEGSIKINMIKKLGPRVLITNFPANNKKYLSN